MNCDVNKNYPVVSIIMPAFNAAAFISLSVRAVLAQVYKSFELIIVDDCSTDNTYELAKSFADNDFRIKLFMNNENSGPAITRNHGLKYATGRYIAFCDSDDIWSPDKLSIQIAFMQKKNIALSHTSYLKMTVRGELIGSFKVRNRTVLSDILKHNCICCSTAVIDTAFTGDFRMPDIRRAEDYALWQILLQKGFVFHGLYNELIKYRVSSESESSNKIAAAYGHWTALRKTTNLNFFKLVYFFGCYFFISIRRIIFGDFNQ